MTTGSHSDSDSHHVLGAATIGQADADGGNARLSIEGLCVTETIAVLHDGGRGMPLEALEQIRTQVIDVVDAVVSAYDAEIASGEVGQAGTAIASPADPRGGKCPTGLLYGRVQSGKTAAMIMTTAMAVDNGFRVFIVLTSNNVKLVKQTYRRFNALRGPLVFSSIRPTGASYVWERDRANVERRIGTRGAVFVCAKDSAHLRALFGFLQSIGATNFPALIMDDEADQATPDTFTAARSRGRPVPASSTTFRRVVSNDAPGEEGESVREVLRHNVFLQVTATPYGLLLQNVVSEIRPSFTCLLKPGEGYTGGESFFSHVDQGGPPLFIVDDQEAAILRTNPSGAPPGLARSIAFFLLAATAHKAIEGAAPSGGYKYLCHTSMVRVDHSALEALIRRYADSLADELEDSFVTARNRPEIVAAYENLLLTVPDAPELDDLLRDLNRHLPNKQVLVINAQGDELDYGGRFNFLVGGNILGRGLTIDDLFVTYYLRHAQTTQMDTMLQHARMYGYRAGIMRYTRVFLPQALADRFAAIHQSEEALRELLIDGNSVKPVPIQVIGNLRPTRNGILDVNTIGAYRAGQQVYPVDVVHAPEELGDSVADLDRMVAEACGGTRVDGRPFDLPFDTMADFIRTVVVQEDDGDWVPEALLRVLEILRGRYANGYLYVRSMERSSAWLSTGSISNTEQNNARARRGPTLFLFKDDANRDNAPFRAPIWHPTIVFPSDMDILVFNRT